MYVSGNVYINSDFVNTSTAAYLNNGVLYLTGNFSNNQPAMAEGTGTTRFNGTSLQLINGTEQPVFHNVYFENAAAGISMGIPVTINNSLTLTNGNLDINSNNLNLGNAVGAVGGGPFSATNMIIASGGGAVVKNGTSASSASYTFPVGDNIGIAEYSPITLTFTTGTYTNGSAGVKVVNAKHPNSSNAADFLNRYWTVATSGYTVTGATVTATYTDADVAGTEANILMDRYDGSLPWTRFPSSINTATNTLTSPSISLFGDFSGEGCTAGLAIEVSTLGNVSACYDNTPDDGNGFFTIRVFPRTATIATAFKPYSWTLDGTPTDPTPEPSAPFKFPGLAQKTYTLSMTDGSGCASNTLTDIAISKDTPLVVTVSSFQKPGCNSSNGQMVVFANYGSHNSYRYSYSTDGGATYSTPQSGHRFTGLAAGDYVIRATDSRECEGTLNFTLPAPASCPAIAGSSTDALSETAKNALKLQVHPNPTRTSFTLNLQSSSKENVQITVTDMLGKKVYQTTGSSSQQYIFGQEFNSGMYIVQVIQGKHIQTLKLVKGN